MQRRCLVPPIKSRLHTIELDVGKLTKKLMARYVNAIKFSARAWVKEAEANIPQYSGASHASLEAIAAGVGAPSVSVFATQSAREHLGPTEIARRQAQARSESRGGFKQTATGISFFYETSLFWLALNETSNQQAAMGGRLITPGPYNFREKADKVAQEVITERLKGRTIDLRGTLKIGTLQSG